MRFIFRPFCRGWVLLAACVCLGSRADAALTYLSPRDLAARLQSLTNSHAPLARLVNLTNTLSGQPVWLIEMGASPAEQRQRQPAMLAIAGTEGSDLAGTVSLVSWAESLGVESATNPIVRQFLEQTTIYIIPCFNPDGVSAWFAQPRREVTVNTRPQDEDHDGFVDEDGPEDLDGDGLITAMRVRDPDGEYIADPNDPRLLIKADAARGEAGAWKVYTEGRDNDGDEAWNEDGPGGVNPNRNFPCQFRFFAPWAGEFPMSETPARALAEFVIAHPNIGLVFAFGSADNLLQTPKAEAPKRPPTALHEADLPLYRELGKSWRESLGLKKELSATNEPGTFADWMYYHRGRLALAARPWSLPLQLEAQKAREKPAEKAKEEKRPAGQGEPAPAAEPKREAEGESTKPEPAKSEPVTLPAETNAPAKDPKVAKSANDAERNQEERAWLKWMDTNAPGSFVSWQPFAHPDFPGKHVEIGGYAPFASINPPEPLLQEWAAKHGRFLTSLAGKLPRLQIREIKVKPLGHAVFDVTLKIENTGYLPTMTAQGALTREVNPTRVVLSLPETNILAGTRITVLGPIPGSGGMKEIRYILNGREHPRVDLEVISTLAESVRATINLTEDK